MDTRLRKQCNEALQFFNEGTLSKKNSDCTQQPFFLKNKSDELEVGFDNAKVEKILNEVKLPNKIKRIYQVIGETNLEHYTGNWILMSLEKVKDLHDNYIEKGQQRATDFAFIYAGLGHIVVCSYDQETDKIYYRLSGGGNDYDRIEYKNFANTYEPQEKHLHDIQHFFDTVKNQDSMDVLSIPRVN